MKPAVIDFIYKYDNSDNLYTTERFAGEDIKEYINQDVKEPTFQEYQLIINRSED